MSNSVTLTGHLGADPVTRTASNGSIFVTARIAHSSSYKNRSGEQVDDTQWFNLVAFGNAAEQLAANYKCGSYVEVGGSLTSRKYEDKTGASREAVSVRVFRCATPEASTTQVSDKIQTATPPVEEVEEVLPF